MITGRRAINGFWAGYAAAHIFPRAFENVWRQNGYSRWVTNLQTHQEPRLSIDSVRNGFLMEGSLHTQFDAWYFSVNPDVSPVSLHRLAEL